MWICQTARTGQVVLYDNGCSQRAESISSIQYLVSRLCVTAIRAVHCVTLAMVWQDQVVELDYVPGRL